MVGYWVGDVHRDFPDPSMLTDHVWDQSVQKDVVDYLQSGFIAGIWAGHASCRLCGAHLGYRDLSDGEFVWPEGLDHYVSIHSVWLPESFVAHVRSTLDALDRAERTSTWWVASVTSRRR